MPTKQAPLSSGVRGPVSGPVSDNRNELHEAAGALYALLAVAVRQDHREISLTAAATLATLERTGPRRVTDLAASEGVAQPSMTSLVIGLERSGLVERRRGTGDLREVLVSLTPAGERHLQVRRRAGADALAVLMDKLPRREAATLVAAVPALERLRELDREQRASTVPPARPGAG